MCYKRRYYEKGAVYYVTSVTKDRKTLLNKGSASLFLICSLAYHKFIFSYRIYAFVIMPDHFHALIQPEGNYDISKIMNYIKGTFARKYNKMFKHKGIVWQKSFHDKVCRTEKEVLRKIEYTHNNPVKIGMVKKPGDYMYSSYQQCLGQRTSDFVDKIR